MARDRFEYPTAIEVVYQVSRSTVFENHNPEYLYGRKSKHLDLRHHAMATHEGVWAVTSLGSRLGTQLRTATRTSSHQTCKPVCVLFSRLVAGYVSALVCSTDSVRRDTKQVWRGALRRSEASGGRQKTPALNLY